MNHDKTKYKKLYGQGFFVTFLCHSSSLDAETEAAYDNYKSYYWKSSILWFPGMAAKRKNGDMPRTEHTYYYY